MVKGEPEPKKIGRRWGTLLKALLSGLWVIVSVLLTILGALYGVHAYIDARIKSNIEDPAFIRQLSRSLRPSVVFDEKGSVLADLGAMRYIKDIQVELAQDGRIDIVVSPVEHLGVEPVLEALDGDFVVYAERGHKFDWAFRLHEVSSLLIHDAPQRERLRFRLELIR